MQQYLTVKINVYELHRTKNQQTTVFGKHYIRYKLPYTATFFKCADFVAKTYT